MQSSIRSIFTTTAIALLALAGNPAFSATTATVIAPKKAFRLSQRLAPERPSVYLFYRPAGGLEKALAKRLERQYVARAGIFLVPVKTGKEPLVKSAHVVTTPTAFVFDRRGRKVLQTTDPEAVDIGIQMALAVMRLDAPTKGDSRLDEVRKLAGIRVPTGGILHTMAYKPTWLTHVYQLTQEALFTDGYLDVRTKNLIAAHVSALNGCRYCVSSHAEHMQHRGDTAANTDAVATGHAEKARLPAKERKLLEYVRLLTLEPAKVTDGKMDTLRAAGWTDEQLFEASFITSLFAFYNRMAEAYGLGYPMNGWLPPALRTAGKPDPKPINRSKAGPTDKAKRG
jgi:uncharacterized peroxidase-related enzyme